MAEKVLKFLASRRGQNVFPRLKGHNQNCISWRDVFNMLKNLRKSDLVSSVSGASLPAFFSIVFRISQQSLTQFFSNHWHDYMTVKIIFFFCADTILHQCYSLLKNHVVYQEYDTRPHKCIKLLKLQEKLDYKLQKQRIVTCVNVLVNVAMVVSAASITYRKLFQVFTMGMDFCSNWKNQRNINSESASNAASVMVGIRKKC